MDNENNFNNPKKDAAKEKIILFAIGTLLGAVIASAAFLICANTLGVNNNAQSSQQMPGGTPPEMPSGQNGSNNGNNQGTPPEMPNGQNGSNSQNNQNSDQNQSTNKSNTNSQTNN